MRRSGNAKTPCVPWLAREWSKHVGEGPRGAGRITSSPGRSSAGLSADEVHVVVVVAVAVDADGRRGGVEVGDIVGG
jgi:hypothetical protein